MAESTESMDVLFPTYNYPFYPDGTHHQSFVDYGSTSSYDIHIDENDRSVYTKSKHCHRGHSEMFVGVHPTIPLMRPSKTVYPTRCLPHVIYRPKKGKPNDFKLTIIEQIGDFYRDNPDIAFPAGREMVNSELECEPWTLECFTGIKLGENHWLDTQDKHKYELQRFAKSFVTTPLNRNADIKYAKMKVVCIPPGLSEAMLDIPTQLVYDLMNESIDQQKNDLLYFDIFQGNTLSYCELSCNQSSNGVLFYPSGPNLETLNMNLLTFKDNNDEGDQDYIPKPVLIDPCHQVPVNSAIRQIHTVNIEHDGVFAVARSQYSCSFVQMSDDCHKLNVVGTFESEDELVDATASPYIHGEAIVVTSQGDIHIWKHGKKTDTLNVPSPAPDEKWPWYQCVYGGHPRCIIAANLVEADMLDVRGNRLSKTFFSVKSKQVDLHERISAVQRHPDNTHQYFIATDQSLLIMDDRYLQHPVLKWHHHLQDPVQFIDIVPNVVPNCKDSVIVVSGSFHYESHCYQFSDGQSTVSPTLIDGSGVTPPVSTSLPWKVLSYDKWPSLQKYTDLQLSSILKDRLTSSLIGVTCIPQNKTGFCILQMSALGDVFYQPFMEKKTPEQHKTSGDESQNNLHLSNESREFCQQWIKDLVTMEANDERKQNLDLNSNVLESDCGSQFDSMIDLETPHDLCALCVDDSVCNADTSLAGTVCQRCGIDVVIGMQLVKAKKQNTIVTSQIYTFNEPSVDLNIFPDAGVFQNSVSQGFRQLWMSDEPMPIELKAQQDTSQDKSTTDNNDNEQQTKQNIVESKADNEDIADVKAQVGTTSKTIAKITPMTTTVTMATSQSITTNVTLLSPGNTMETTPSVPSTATMVTASPSKANTSSPVKTKKKKLMGF